MRIDGVPDDENTLGVETGSGNPLGWAHGDDRGEFLLVIDQDSAGIGQLGGVGNDQVNVTLTIGARIPPLDPNIEDPLRVDKDPLWDLPIEQLGNGPWPPNNPQVSGRQFLPQHQQFQQPPRAIPLGRTTSIEYQIN